MRKEFTATCYIIEENRVLLHLHKKLGMWLPPGGHVEENETPVEAAKREVMEECGLEVEILSDERFWVGCPTSNSFERPALCLLENIPAWRDNPAHQHMDLIYTAKPKVGSQLRNGCGFQWFSWEELEGMELLEDVREVLQKLLTGATV